MRPATHKMVVTTVAIVTEEGSSVQGKRNEGKTKIKARLSLSLIK